MSSKVIIAIVVALAVIGGGAFIITNNGNDENGSQASTASSDSPKQGDDAAEISTIKELVSRNKDVTCTFSGTEQDGAKNSGTVYVSKGRMNGDFILEPAGKPVQKSHIIQDGTYQYVWIDGKSEGTKIKLSAMESLVDEEKAKQQAQQPVDQDKKFDFSCSDWNVDESVFTPPSNVTFSDLSAQLEQAQRVQQNACASITDAQAKQACQNAL